MKKKIDSISDPFDREYFKVKQLRLLKKILINPKQVDQVVIMMIILVILMNMTVEMMGVIYHRISFYIIFLSFS